MQRVQTSQSLEYYRTHRLYEKNRGHEYHIIIESNLAHEICKPLEITDTQRKEIQLFGNPERKCGEKQKKLTSARGIPVAEVLNR
jgi:hypothetical protein